MNKIIPALLFTLLSEMVFAEDSIDELTKQCNLGNAQSCNLLGIKYAEGKEVGQDLPKAIEIFSKACDSNSSEACNNLGFIHSGEYPNFIDEAKTRTWRWLFQSRTLL